MKELHELKAKMMDELKEQSREIVKKGRMTAGDLDNVAKLTKSIDRLCDIVEDEDGGDYSNAGNWRADIRGDYGDGYSGRRRRDSRGRYSRNDRDHSMMDHSYGSDSIAMLEDVRRNEKDPRKREAIDRLIRVMEG